MTVKIDVQDVKNRLLNGETPSQLANWYTEELGINVTRQAISQHRQKLVKEGKLQKGKAGRPLRSYIKKETTKYKTRIRPTEAIELLKSVADIADKAAKAEDMAKSAHEAAEAASRNTKAVVKIGGEAVVLFRQAADQAVKRAEEASNTLKEAAQTAMKTFSEESTKAINRAEEAAITTIEASSKKATDEAAATAEEAVPNELLKNPFYCWESRVFWVIVVSASIFSAVCLSLGMTLIGK